MKKPLDMKTTADWIWSLINQELDRLPETERMDVLDLVDADSDEDRTVVSLRLFIIANKIRNRASDRSKFESARNLRRQVKRSEREQNRMEREIDAQLDAEEGEPND